MKQFFFDTANIESINSIWSKLPKTLDPSNALGVTTNPNALNKIGITKVNQLKELIEKLANKISEIRSDDEGIIYIQIPNSNNTIKEIQLWIDQLISIQPHRARICLKIPPRSDIFHALIDLDLDGWQDFDLNITGICDAGTALKCLSYPVKYVSILAGRMQDAGINLHEQVDYIQSRAPDDKGIIAGSMRTINGLKDTIALGCVPTIGEKIWGLILQDPSFWDTAYAIRENNNRYCPLIAETSLSLSEAFFAQMDLAGQE
ncbi:MAG: transaldolase family protein, partial [bacterium]|nr:transaldolase family protein [bacterium]